MCLQKNFFSNLFLINRYERSTTGQGQTFQPFFVKNETLETKMATIIHDSRITLKFTYNDSMKTVLEN